jgi:hypothetical protein
LEKPIQTNKEFTWYGVRPERTERNLIGDQAAKWSQTKYVCIEILGRIFCVLRASGENKIVKGLWKI